MLRHFCIATGIIALLVSIETAQAGSPETSDVFAPFNCDFATTPCNDVGNAKLVRNKNGVAMNIQTTGLEGGAAYTAWWVIFNNPGACVDGCNSDDFGTANVKATIIWATGTVVGGNGMAGFAAHLREGDTTNVGPFGLPGDAFGLIDAMTAEIFLVVRSHGPTIPSAMPAQIKQFLGGCPPNICEDKQFALFPAP